MSSIDTIQHELVGFLNGLPIYHPLETKEANNWDDIDFSCSYEDLVLGGGGGEHPALVLHNLGAMVAKYILYSIRISEEHYPERLPFLLDSTKERIKAMSYTDNNLDFCGWRISHYHSFYEKAKHRLNRTPLENNGSAEDWIELSIGEFVYYSLPELNPYQYEIQALEGVIDWIPFNAYWMCNVSCPAPNYYESKKASKFNGGIRPGYFRWDFKYPPDE